jgi:hypothetical protein
MIRRFAVFVVLGVVAALPSAWADAASIASHRAAYVLSLGNAKANSGVSAIEGGMYIDWQEVCGGWTIAQRMRFKVYAEEGEVIDNDISFSSWEAQDGLSYRFTLRTVRNGDVVEQLRGRATLDGRGKPGKVEFSEPDGEVLDLPAGTIFPTEHSLQLLKAAMGNDRTLSRIVFDGASLDGALEINAVIGPRLAPEKIDNPNVAGAITNRPSWRMRMAFFKTASDQQQQSEPEYETGMRVLDNGVGYDFLFEYDDFSIKAKLDRLEALPAPKC